MKKQFSTLLFFILLVLGSCRKTSQEYFAILQSVDSLMQTNPNSALQLLKTISTPQKMKKADRAWYALLTTQAQYKNYVPLENDSLIRTAIDYYKHSTEKEQLAKSYFYWGCVHREQKNTPAAVDCYLQSLRNMPKECDSTFLAMIYYHSGECYKDQNMTETARKMYQQARDINLRRHDTLRAFHNVRGIGTTFFLELQLDSATYHHKQALEMSLSLDYPVPSGIIYKDLSGYYYEQKRYEQAYTYISKAIANLSDIEDLTSAYSIKGDILYQMGEKDSALYYWHLGKESPDIYTKTSNYDNIYRINKELSNWETAVLYADSFIVYYDSIQTMNDRAEIDSLTDDHQLELHKYKLSVKQRRTTYFLLGLFLFLALSLSLLFLWRDRKRKNKYMALQKQLRENRVETLSLAKTDIPKEEKKDNRLYELKKEKFDICISLFKSTEGYKRLNELEEAKPKERINIIKRYRAVITIDIKRSFVDIMEDLNNICPTLTHEDLLYCVLTLLQCPKEIIMDVMDTSSDAIKTRKNRIKNKMGKDLFESIFSPDYLLFTHDILLFKEHPVTIVTT